MAAAAAKKTVHYFVINQLGQSATRLGAFVSREAAEAYAGNHYAGYPAWILPAEYVGKPPYRPLDADGNRIQEG